MVRNVRTNSKRRRPNSVRRYGRSTPKPITVAVKRQINRMAETKRLQRAIGITVSSVGVVTPLLTVAQGTAEGERIGDHLTLKKLALRWQVTAADSSNTVRCLIFQWKQYTTPGLSDVLNLTAPDFVSIPFIAPYNIVTDSSYKILMDRVLVVDTDDPVKWRRKTIYKGITHKINFQGASGTSATYNQIYIAFVSDSGATSHPAVAATVDLSYKDF